MLPQVVALDREDVRAYVAHFSRERMVDDYRQVYDTVVQQRISLS